MAVNKVAIDRLMAPLRMKYLAQLKEWLPAGQVLMVTVDEDPDRIFRALRAGASGYILKRSTPEQVLSAVGDVLQGGVPMSSGIARKFITHFQDQKAANTEIEKLSAREREVLDLVVNGFSSKEIADRLQITLAGVRWHLRNIYQKLHVHSRVDAVLKVRPPA